MILLNSIFVVAQKSAFETKLSGEREGLISIIRATFVNNTDENISLAYVMKVNHVDSEGFKTKLYSGAFDALANYLQLLETIEIKISETDYYSILLEVYKDTERIGVDLLESKDYRVAEKNALLADSLNTISALNQMEVQKKKPKKDSFDAIEIDGLIIDETRSKLGRDFYDFFYGEWSPPKNAKDFVITIKELPARGRGAQVSVEVNGNTLVRRFLQPRNDLIESTAKQIAQAIADYLAKNEDLKNELGSDDQEGSGIF